MASTRNPRRTGRAWHLVSLGFVGAIIGFATSAQAAWLCPEGMVAYWTFDDGTAADLLGQNGGTVVGTGLTSVPGQVGSAYRFPPMPYNSTGPEVVVPNSATLDAALMDEITLEGWVTYPAWPPVYHTYLPVVLGPMEIMLRQHYSLNSGQPFFVMYALAQSGERILSEPDGAQPVPWGATVRPSGGWYHVAATYSSTTGVADLYVNGVWVTMRAISPSRLTPTVMGTPTVEFRMGVHEVGSTHFNNGQILDEVAAYKRVLNEQEIREHFERGLMGDGYCRVDTDGDGIADSDDACPYDYSGDTDGDGLCDSSDSCPWDYANDIDGDGVCESQDNCPVVANDNQSDQDGDGGGDACEPDNDADGVIDDDDDCPLVANPDQLDNDQDGVGDACDGDDDNDGIVDGFDACAGTPPGTPVLDNGCSVAQQCPCENPWKNHGAYVSCVAKACSALVRLGFMSQVTQDATVSAAAQSGCGYAK